MQKVRGTCSPDWRALAPQQARPELARLAVAENARSNNGWSLDLAVLDRVVARRSRSSRNCPAIRVVLAERAGLVRAGLRSVLEREHDFSVVGEAMTGEEAVTQSTEKRPDVVVMDIRLPGLSGLEATRRILAKPHLTNVRVVILTSDEQEEDLFDALRSGASGFVLLDTEPGELLRAVRAVASGGVQLSPWATSRLLKEFASSPNPPDTQPEQFDELTSREREIVSLVALGLTNDEIAQRLVVSPATVKTHVSRAMLKLHARDRARLVALAYQTGFVQAHGAVNARVAPDDYGLGPAAPQDA